MEAEVYNYYRDLGLLGTHTRMIKPDGENYCIPTFRKEDGEIPTIPHLSVGHDGNVLYVRNPFTAHLATIHVQYINGKTCLSLGGSIINNFLRVDGFDVILWQMAVVAADHMGYTGVVRKQDEHNNFWFDGMLFLDFVTVSQITHNLFYLKVPGGDVTYFPMNDDGPCLDIACSKFKQHVRSVANGKRRIIPESLHGILEYVNRELKRDDFEFPNFNDIPSIGKLRNNWGTPLFFGDRVFHIRYKSVEAANAPNGPIAAMYFGRWVVGFKHGDWIAVSDRVIYKHDPKDIIQPLRNGRALDYLIDIMDEEL